MPASLASWPLPSLFSMRLPLPEPWGKIAAYWGTAALRHLPQYSRRWRPEKADGLHLPQHDADLLGTIWPLTNCVAAIPNGAHEHAPHEL